MDPRNISIEDYTYQLPDVRIARYPLAERDASRLLIYKGGMIREDRFLNIADHIPENSLLVFNNTKVVEARLLFQKPTGAIVEIFCLEPHEQYADITTALFQKSRVNWRCLVGGASKWKRGQILEKSLTADNQEIVLRAAYVEKKAGYFIIELSWFPPGLSFAEILHYSGTTPLPPYIKRAVELTDAERYQTIYALEDGSVAAHTAGLHFTVSIFEKLKAKEIQTEFVTLHVGAGTFKPVQADTMQGHEMQPEWFAVSKETIEKLILCWSGNIIAIGTTSARAIESLYWLGVKFSENPQSQTSEIGQWEPY